MNVTSSETPPIDLDLFPLDGRDDAVLGRVIRDAQNDLVSQQYCSFPGFFPADQVARIAAETTRLIDRANPANSYRNCYLEREKSSAYPDDHPRNILNHASYRMIAADLFPATSPLKQLYNWEPFRNFVAAIVGEDAVYPSEDPLQPVNVICYGDGDQSAWHYDSTNAFTMTLMLQAANEGGLFELAPNTRQSEDVEDISYMKEVLTGGRDRVRTISRAPGELTIFRGCNSLHRVSSVRGDALRMMAVFVYETEPGIVGDPAVNLTVYGRTGLPE